MPKRTTLTLEDDVMRRLRDESRRTGRSIKDTVNDAIRHGLEQTPSERHPGFRVRARKLSARPGVQFDDVSALLEQVEGPMHR